MESLEICIYMTEFDMFYLNGDIFICNIMCSCWIGLIAEPEKERNFDYLYAFIRIKIFTGLEIPVNAG